jgi:hypothetical protein
MIHDESSNFGSFGGKSSQQLAINLRVLLVVDDRFVGGMRIKVCYQFVVTMLV